MYFDILEKGQKKQMRRSDINKLHPNLLKIYEEEHKIKFNKVTQAKNIKIIKRKKQDDENIINKYDKEIIISEETTRNSTNNEENKIECQVESNIKESGTETIFDFLPTDTDHRLDIPTEKKEQLAGDEKFVSDIPTNEDVKISTPTILNDLVLERMNELSVQLKKAEKNTEKKRKLDVENNNNIHLEQLKTECENLRKENYEFNQKCENMKIQINQQSGELYDMQLVYMFTLKQAEMMSKNANEVGKITKRALQKIAVFNALIGDIKDIDNICTNLEKITRETINGLETSLPDPPTDFQL